MTSQDRNRWKGPTETGLETETTGECSTTTDLEIEVRSKEQSERLVRCVEGRLERCTKGGPWTLSSRRRTGYTTKRTQRVGSLRSDREVGRDTPVGSDVGE